VLGVTMKLFLLLSVALVGVNATDVNPTCAAKVLLGSITESSGALTTNTVTAANTPCQEETPATCFARTDGKQHFCAATKTCHSDCSSCAGNMAMGNVKDDGTGTDTLAASNNTCKNALLAMCQAERLGAGKKHYCDIAAVKGCYANCDSCVDASDTTNNKLKVEAAAGGTCGAHTAGTCFALTATQHLCPNDKSCAANCSACTGKFAAGNFLHHGEPGGDGTEPLSNSNNTCQVVTAPMCYFGRMGATLLQYCDTDKTCKADCLSCANLTVLGKHKADASGDKALGSYANNKFPEAAVTVAHDAGTAPQVVHAADKIVYTVVQAALITVNDVVTAAQASGTQAFGAASWTGYVKAKTSEDVTFSLTPGGTLQSLADPTAAGITVTTYPISGNVCQVASAALCWAEKQETGKKNFCDTTGHKKCVTTDTATTTGCSDCMDATASQNWLNDGTATAVATSGNNTCKVATHQMCSAEKLGAGKKHFCDIASTNQPTGGTGKGCYADCLGCAHNTPASSTFKMAAASGGACAANDATSCFAETTNKYYCAANKSCHADCDTCAGNSAPSTFHDNGTTADTTLSASTNTCKPATKEMCFNSKFSGKPEFCDVTNRCQANCDGAEPPAGVSPAGTTAPGIFAALAAAVAFALRM